MSPMVSWTAVVFTAALVASTQCICQAFERPIVDFALRVANQRFGLVVPPSSSSTLLGMKGGATSAEVSADSTSKPSIKPFKFYTLEGGFCPYAARTWITLLELGLPFEMIEVNAMKKQSWFLDINPRGKVPAIQNTEDGFIIYESAICDEYLSEVARQLENSHLDGTTVWKLMPVDPSDRAALRLLNDIVDTQMGTSMFTFLMNKDATKDPDFIESLENALTMLQESLVTRGGPYLMGEEFTLADVHVLPFFLRMVVSLKHFKSYEVPKEKFSRLLDWFDVCSERESVRAAGKSEEEIIKVYRRFVEVDYSFGGLNKNKK